MPKKYTPQEKDDALFRLDMNLGDLPLTSIHTAIPERTLRDWRKQRRLEQKAEEKESQQENLPPKKNDSAAAVEELQKLRDRLMQIIFDLSDSLGDNGKDINQRSIALSRLLDRVLKLDSQIKQMNPQTSVTRFEFIQNGKTYDVPPWTLPQDDALFAQYQPTEEETENAQNDA